MHSHLKPRRVLAASFAAALAVAMVPTLAGANLAGSTFESTDGNLIHASGTDWDNAPNRVRGDDLASGKGDNSFGQGTKEDLLNVTVVNGSIPPNKSDLTRFYIANESANNSQFLYLAWERTNTLGSANMDFEINKLAQPDLTTKGAKVLNRSPGDLLVRYDFTNGGTVPTLTLVKWLTAANGDTVGDCFKNSALPCWGASPTDDALDGVDDDQIDLSDAGFADGATNTVTVHDPIANVDLPEATFGEAAIDLTAAGVFEEGECTSFGSAYLKSRSSSAFDAETKDFVAPQEINISNCGNIIIQKVTDPSPDPTDTSFAFTLTGGPSALNASFSLKNGESNATAGADVLAGSGYNAAETLPANWTLVSAICDDGSPVTNIDVAVDETVTCTFTNKLNVGAIMVTKTRKHAADGSGDHPHAGVDFTVNGVTKTTDANGQACFDGLTFGDYSVHETVPAGYAGEGDKQVTVDNVAFCDDDPYVGETVSFHNTPLTNITVSVDSQIDGGTASTIDCDGVTGSTGVNGDGSLTRNDLEPGTYTCTIVVDP